MLRISTLVSLQREVTLQLDGHVTGAWVELLRDSAEAVLLKGWMLTLDMENVRFIDCEGVALINRLLNYGVRQENMTLFVAEQIKKCEA